MPGHGPHPRLRRAGDRQLFFRSAGGGKTLLGMVLNMELGRFLAETAAFLRECPQARDADILFGL